MAADPNSGKKASDTNTNNNDNKTGGALYNDSNLTDSQYDLPADAGFCLEKDETRAKNRFNGKVAIVTGGAGNFGAAGAERLVSEGAKVALWDIRDASDVQKNLENKYKNLKPQIISCIADVTNEDSVQAALLKVITKFGRVDMLFNNAGYQGDFTKTHEYEVKDFSKVMNINVVGVFTVLKTVANAMISQKPQGGVIVNTASMAGHGSPANMIAYGTSKAAVIHMTRIASLDLAPYNIRVNSISPAFIGPGFMWTRQIELQAKADSIYYDKDPNIVKDQMIGGVPLKRYGSLNEVIGPVMFLLSDDASYLTGVDIKITGGLN